MKVGMARRRYVVFGWHQAWTVDYKTAVERAGLGEEGFDAAKNPQACPWSCLVPRMWRSLDGGFDKVTFEKALHAVLTYIVERPGVSKVPSLVINVQLFTLSMFVSVLFCLFRLRIVNLSPCCLFLCVKSCFSKY